MATKLTPVRSDMYEEDVSFQNSISQQLLSKFGQNIQHYADKHFMHWNFKFLGDIAPRPVNGAEDGVLTAPYDFEICGFSFSARVIGGSGITFTTFDIHKIDVNGVDQGSIFLTKPSFTGNADDGHRGYFVNYIEGTNSGVISGVIYPNFTQDADRLFVAGDSLRLDLDLNDSEAKDIMFNIFYRAQ